MPWQGVGQRFSFMHGAVKVVRLLVALPFGPIIWRGLQRAFTSDHGLLSHNNWTFGINTVQTERRAR